MELKDKGPDIPEHTSSYLSGLIKHCRLLSVLLLKVERIAGVRDAQQSPQSLAGLLYIS
jgi:hypothetical protein